MGSFGRRAVLSAIVRSILVCLVALLSPIAAAEDLADELRSTPYKIVYETWRDGNWELFVSSADGSKLENLTSTPDTDEMYPHASPDGTKLAFVCDEGQAAAKVRNVYVMNMDGTERTLVARNARQPCWKADSTAIAYLKGEVEQFSYTDYASKGVCVYEVATGKHTDHPNADLFHLYNLCWSPDSKCFLATVHAGMGYSHAILAFDAEGSAVHDLKIPGCRPDISPDGRRVAWGASDWVLRVGELDFSGEVPRIVNARDVVTSEKPMKIYHADWSPDGKYLAFSRGPDRKILGLIPEIVGAKARGWDIGVADASQTNRMVMITSDGNCNKEPDWIPVKKDTP
ncbi:MAG: hypothetical protein JJ992_23860 [Planctomycetes bacterium]|nr:hypothetical protein [Planctomycetota bacterium]